MYRKSNPPLPAVPDTPLIDFEIKTLRGRTTKFKLPADPEFIADFRNRLRGDVGAAKFAGPAEFWRDETGAGKLFSGIDPTEIARLVRKDIARIKEALRGTTALTPAEAERVTVDPAKGAADDISIFRRIFATPLSAVRRFPGLSDLIIKGMRADIDQSRFINRLNREYRAIAKPLTKDEFSQLGDLLLVGDSEGTEYSITHLKDQGISPKVITAYGKMRRYFDKLGRFVDQHERAMRPQYRERKASLLRQMARLRDMDTAEFRKLYGQRSRLRTKLRRGEGDPEALAARLDEIDVRLQDIREQTDEYQDMLAEADQLDAKLARLSVRRRIGYFPHKFFGSWRLFQLGERTGEGGESEPYWQHIAGPHGFFVSREAAIKAARQFLRAHPDAQLRVSPVAFTFPNSAATQMTDPAYWRFMDRLGKTLGIEGDELHELISGLARRRFRRRVAGFAQFRKGLEGYSKNVDRVIQTHTGEVVRYVMMDRLKYDAINTIEREGLSPNAQANQERPQLAKMVNTWLTDINGQKRPGGWEQALDNLITRDAAWTRPANLGLGTGALAFAATGGFTGNPLIGALAGSYVGYRFFRARARGGEFPTRALTGAMTSDMAHLKLGAFLNVFSPLVNLSQTLINTYPILGEKYTLVGLKKLAAAAKSAARGEPNNDWRLLLRADIASRFKYTETSSNLFNRESRLAFWSLFLFNSAEQFNRSVSYLGAFHRAVDRGAAHAQALKEAEGIGIRSPGMIRTQFLYSNANKPEVLRNVILRVPGQFKNFVAQEIAFALNLRGAEIPRFLLASFLLAGGLGMPGADLLDWLMQFLFDYSPIEEAKRQTLEAQAEGELQGTAANVLLRGLPSLAGTDVSTRIGLGDKFLPLQIRDWKGPWWSTFEKSAYLGEKNATMVDHLRNLSTGVGAPLKSLEAAANGMPLLETLVSDPKRLVEALGAGEARLTSAWKNGNLEYRPTTGELALKAIGGTPLREAQLRDVYQITRRAERQARKDTRGYLDRIVAAYLFNERDEADRRVGAILDEADENGVVISKQQVRRAVEDAQRSRPERLLRRTRRQLRPEIEELLRGVGQ